MIAVHGHCLIRHMKYSLSPHCYTGDGLLVSSRWFFCTKGQSKEEEDIFGFFNKPPHFLTTNKSNKLHSRRFFVSANLNWRLHKYVRLVWFCFDKAFEHIFRCVSYFTHTLSDFCINFQPSFKLHIFNSCHIMSLKTFTKKELDDWPFDAVLSCFTFNLFRGACGN